MNPLPVRVLSLDPTILLQNSPAFFLKETKSFDSHLAWIVDRRFRLKIITSHIHCLKIGVPKSLANWINCPGVIPWKWMISKKNWLQKIEQNGIRLDASKVIHMQHSKKHTKKMDMYRLSTGWNRWIFSLFASCKRTVEWFDDLLDLTWPDLSWQESSIWKFKQMVAAVVQT